MDNTDEMKRLHARGLLPPAFAKLVDAIGLEDVPLEAQDLVRQVIGLTEGQNLVNRLIAKFLGTVLEADKIARSQLAQEFAEQPEQAPEPMDIEEAVEFARFLDTKGTTIEEFDALNEAERAILKDEYDHWDHPAEAVPATWNDRFIAWLETQQLTTQDYKAKTEREQSDLRLAFAEVDTGAADATTPPPFSGDEIPPSVQQQTEQPPEVQPETAPKAQHPQLDHDGDGKDGGSLKGEQSTVRKGQRAKAGTAKNRTGRTAPKRSKAS